MSQRAAVFSCLGLGDGLISCVLSHNLFLNGYHVTTFHPYLHELQSWFPHLPLANHDIHTVASTLDQVDKIFIFLEKSPRLQPVLEYSLAHHRHKTVVLNPIATKNRDYPFWEEGQFDGEKSVVDNLYTFCEKRLRLPVTTKSNGITPPSYLHFRKELRRVLIHPLSSRKGKNWDKFVELASLLKKEGFKPEWLLAKHERPNFDTAGFAAPLFDNLATLAHYIYESGYLIGNDSGPGHLSSCLHIPTLTLFCNKKASLFWKPGWGHVRTLCPSSWIPNIKGWRLRDMLWQKWICLNTVSKTFSELCANTQREALRESD